MLTSAKWKNFTKRFGKPASDIEVVATTRLRFCALEEDPQNDEYRPVVTSIKVGDVELTPESLPRHFSRGMYNDLVIYMQLDFALDLVPIIVPKGQTPTEEQMRVMVHQPIDAQRLLNVIRAEELTLDCMAADDALAQLKKTEVQRGWLRFSASDAFVRKPCDRSLFERLYRFRQESYPDGDYPVFTKYYEFYQHSVGKLTPEGELTTEMLTELERLVDLMKDRSGQDDIIVAAKRSCHLHPIFEPLLVKAVEDALAKTPASPKP
ncbi:hypothetical protein [Thalassospira xiamenensis]|uniref:Nucleotidyl transferase AbiEii toxin, Type IV TA system n=1 Tax=Thalassospira xiamenensis TaxID=220697 RepID=A0A285TXK9_9PROT|nr:hypothetical protein [Thalassospira xiamenensis]SOC27028.1 hypothetical protein SAMN05428964_105254 [Thalassospira xiamenensis]